VVILTFTFKYFFYMEESIREISEKRSLEQSLQPDSAIVTVCAAWFELKKPGTGGTNRANVRATG
jgi:hypothetical protein